MMDATGVTAEQVVAAATPIAAAAAPRVSALTGCPEVVYLSNHLRGHYLTPEVVFWSPDLPRLSHGKR